MKNIKLVLLASISILTFNCTTEVNNSDDMISADTLSVDTTLVELDTTLLAIDDTTNMSEYVDDSKEAESIIEEKYGEQWDFCTCVIKNDSIQKAIVTPDLSDENLDELLEKFEFVDLKCKAFQLEFEILTPEERVSFEQRSKECLIEE